MKTVTTAAKAWITSGSTINHKSLLSGDAEGLVYSNANMTAHGWTLAGEAEITIHLVDERELIDNKVDALKEEAKNIRAEATARCTKIEGQIQELLAITYDAPGEKS